MNQGTIQALKQNHPNGTRVELIDIYDQYTTLTPGTQGTVQFVDDIGTIHVKWDNGSTLGLVPGMDRWKRV